MSVQTRPPPRELPIVEQTALRRAERLCAWTLFWMSLVSTMMFLSMGGSQAMKTALIEDLLSIIPASTFLIASWFRRKGVDIEYVNGRERAFNVNFLISAVALSGVGIALVIEGFHTLLSATRPVVGTFRVGDLVVWQGWLMIAALAGSAVPPIILGRKKLALAKALSLKPLRTDADVGRADWLTALAGIVGVVGIGFGFWWADAAAALVIAGSILHDGATNLRGAVRDLHDAQAQVLTRDRADSVTDQLCQAITRLPWVHGCTVRLHEEGLHLSGMVYLANATLTVEQIDAVRAAARKVSWRIDQIDVSLTQTDEQTGDIPRR